MPSNAGNFGKTGNGKTARTVGFQKLPHFKNLQPRVVDPYGEYVLEKQFKQIDPNCDIFTILNRISNTFLVIDEAQLYLPTNKLTQNEERHLIMTISGCRHRNNYTIFNFGELKKCPYYLRGELNVIYLGHTDDDISSCDLFGSYMGPLLREQFLKLQKTRLIDRHDFEVITNI